MAVRKTPPKSRSKIVDLNFKIVGGKGNKVATAEMVVDAAKLLGVKDLDSSTAEAVGFDVISTIKERTERRQQVYGGGFEPYSDEYKESDEFSTYGKSSAVNMRLTGSMMGLLTVKDVDSSGKVTIGWDDPDENLKAYNHNTGDSMYRRWFLGVTSKELTKIKNNNIALVDIQPSEPDEVGEPSGNLISLGDLISLLGVEF